jgi:hypothetical protein
MSDNLDRVVLRASMPLAGWVVSNAERELTVGAELTRLSDLANGGAPCKQAVI